MSEHVALHLVEAFPAHDDLSDPDQVFGVLSSVQVGRMVVDQPTPWMGAAERVNIYATMLRVAVLATGLLRARDGRRLIREDVRR